MKNVARFVVALALALLPVASALAQPVADVEMTRAEIQKARQAIVAKTIDLTEDEGLAFWPAYRDYRLEMSRLGDRLVRVIQEFLSSDATLTDEQANRLLDEYLDIKAKEVSVRQKHVRSFRKILPAAKVTRFFQVENKMDALIQAELAETIPLAR